MVRRPHAPDEMSQIRILAFPPSVWGRTTTSCNLAVGDDRVPILTAVKRVPQRQPEPRTMAVSVVVEALNDPTVESATCQVVCIWNV